MSNQTATKNRRQRQRRQKPLPAIPAPQATVGPNKKNKNAKKAARRAMAPAAAARAERFYLSPCSKTYLKALCDPFSLDAGMACIPDLRDIPSQKLMVKARHTFAAGTQGFGYTVASPFGAASDASFTMISSTSAYAGTTVAVDTATTGVSGSNASQFPYTTAQIANLHQRTVACGIRVRYLGTELNKSGRMVCVRLPTGSSLKGYSMQNILGNNSVQSVPVSRQWTYVSFVPNNDADYEYFQSSGAIGATDSNNLARLAVVVDGTTAGNSFEAEVVWHKEYYSKNQDLQSVPNLTVSHSDTNGLSAVRNFFEGSIDYLGGPALFQSAIQFVSKYAPLETSHMTTAAGLAYQAARAYSQYS